MFYQPDYFKHIKPASQPASQLSMFDRATALAEALEQIKAEALKQDASAKLIILIEQALVQATDLALDLGASQPEQ